MLDELPMLFGSTCLVCIALMDRDERNTRTLAVGGTAYALLLCAIYFLFPQFFLVFFLGYGLSVSGMFVLSMMRIRDRDLPPVAAECCWASCFSYFFGFGLWCFENMFCKNIPMWLKLHAAWHILAGFGTYMWIQYALVLRALRLKKRPKLSSYLLIPYIRVTPGDDGNL